METLTLGLLGLLLVAAATIIRRFTPPARTEVKVMAPRQGGKPVTRLQAPVTNAKIAQRATGPAISWVPPVPQGDNRELTAVGQ